MAGPKKEAAAAHKPTAENRNVVATMAVYGMSVPSIADHIGISQSELLKHYSADIDKGNRRALTDIKKALYERAVKGDTKALLAIKEDRERAALSARNRGAAVPDEKAPKPHKMTPKEEIFVAEYIVDLNALKAARAAKYGAPQASAYRVLARPHIQEAIRAAKADRLKRLEIDGDDVIRELTKIAFSNILDFFKVETVPLKVGDDGEPLETRGLPFMDLSDVTRQQAAAIGEIGFDQHGRPKLKLADKRAALEALGKHFGIFEMDNRQRVPSAEEVKQSLEDMTPAEAASAWSKMIADV